MNETAKTGIVGVKECAIWPTICGGGREQTKELALNFQTSLCADSKRAVFHLVGYLLYFQVFHFLLLRYVVILKEVVIAKLYQQVVTRWLLIRLLLIVQLIIMLSS